MAMKLCIVHPRRTPRILGQPTRPRPWIRKLMRIRWHPTSLIRAGSWACSLSAQGTHTLCYTGCSPWIPALLNLRWRCPRARELHDTCSVGCCNFAEAWAERAQLCQLIHDTRGSWQSTCIPSSATAMGIAVAKRRSPSHMTFSHSSPRRICAQWTSNAKTLFQFWSAYFYLTGEKELHNFSTFTKF